MEPSRSSPSLTKNSHNHSRRLISSSSSRTKVELHQVDVLLQKEIGRLERQQSAAVSNIANHQQAMKMSWRKLEQKRSLESPLLSSSSEKITLSPSPRRGIFYSNTKLHTGENVWKSEPAPLSSTTSSSPVSQAVKVAGDIHHRRVNQGPPPASLRKISSPYVSSPYSLRRQGPSLPIRTKSMGSQFGVPTLSSSPPVAGSSSDTSDKHTLLMASKLMGVETSSNRPQSFKEFYSAGGTIEKSASAATILVSSALDQSINASARDSDIDEESTTDDQIPAESELTMAQMFDQIKHCRYIRRYHPDGTALEEYF